MHEISLLEDVLAILEDSAKTQGYSKVKKIWLEIGALSCVEPDALRFGFDVVMKNTLADGAELEIITLPGQAKCEKCGHDVELESLYTPCPDCGEFNLHIVAGMDMRVKELMVE